MKRMMALGGLLMVGAISTVARQAPQPPQTAEIEKVRDNLYVIKNGGGNTAAFITANGVVVVDTKLAGWGQRIIDKIRSVTDKPITTIINTHTHGDHTGSNAEFPASVEVVAQENTKTNMEKMSAFQGDKAQFLPKRTFKDKVTLFGGADRVDLYYFGPGHTNGDALIVFPALRTMHTGDLFAGPSTPIMDVGNGGSGVSYPQTIKKAVAGIPGVDTVIPGHSDVTTWSAFGEYGDFMEALVAAVQQGIKEGKTAEETTAALKLPDKFKTYGMNRASANVSAIYGEIKK